MKNKILLIGGTSIIGNAIAAEINYENDFIIIRTVRDKRLANKYSEFIDLSSTKNILESLRKIYSKHQIYLPRNLSNQIIWLIIIQSHFNYKTINTTLCPILVLKK
jgi:hypothetical protein